MELQIIRRKKLQNMGNISFLGDLLFGDQPVIFGCGVDSKWNRLNYIGLFDDVKNVLTSSDYVVANLECVIRKRPKKTDVSNWSMCCDERVINELLNNNIKYVSIANNHSLDYGVNEYNYMISLLKSSGITVLGEHETPFTVIECDGKKIAIVAISYLPCRNITDNIPYFINPTDIEMRKVMLSISYADYKIAYVHWGSEFVTNPSKSQIEIRDRLIAFGFDDIIGCHSHILQKKEKIDHHNIFYGLGNFVSDYWQKRLRKSEIIQLDTLKLSYYYFDCEINKNGTPNLSSERKRVIFLKNEKYPEQSIFWNRIFVRAEYLFKIICIFPKIRNKKCFLKWLYKRLKYIFKNIKEEKTNPNIIYEKYEN